MRLKITIEDRTRELEIPGDIFTTGMSFFEKMDRDMDRGWQMGPEFIEQPTLTNRCQIAAEKILQAVDTQNENLLMLMAGYILMRMPNATGVNIDTSGEPLGTEFTLTESNN
ncbi:MAG: hypothetical protein ACC635_00765 [Acidiferrobacterales bacterium]